MLLLFRGASFIILTETKSKLIQHEINKVGKYLQKPESQKDECELLSFLADHKKLDNESALGRNVEEIKRKEKALQKLIEENIVRQSSTLDKGKISEFYSPKYALAVKKMLKK